MSDYTLGLDMGVASMGWSVVVEPDSATSDPGFVKLGVHRFEAGVTDPGKMGFGGEESSAQPRRDARQMRRQLWRRRRRRQLLLQCLQAHGLLPQGDTSTPDAIHAYLRSIDEAIEQSRYPQAAHEQRLKLPYLLRADAVQAKLALYELGRALTHLAHRRGFLSNRKTDRDDDKNETKFKQDMADLQQQINAHDPPYLGAYLASLDPDQHRLRGKRNSRQMYLDEFEAIWVEQAKHHAALRNDQMKHTIWKTIFNQRPLKSQRHLRGLCSLTGKPRAAMAIRVVQRYRLLQKLNDLLIIMPDGATRGLTPEEREKVFELQLSEGDITFHSLKAKKMLGLPKDATFNLAATEDKLIGHRTDAKLRKVLGETFNTLSEGQLDGIVTDLRSFRIRDPLARRLEKTYGLTSPAARTLSHVKLEQTRAAHSLHAIEMLVQPMEHGVPYATARKELYPESFTGESQAFDLLPGIEDWLKKHERAIAIRNPAVMRGLTEVRKVVNAIIRRYGKPKHIRIELARDLKNSRKRRGEISNQIKERRGQREQAAAELAKDYGIDPPSRSDIEKVLLLWECGGICPYTNKPIEPRKDLFGPNPSFQVEHIWPLSASMDDSFLNKTLCHVDENARKGGRAPADCYDDETLASIRDRAGKFNCDWRTREAKLRRFSEPVPEGFSSRHLNDTRYLAREASNYLGCLFGTDEDTESQAQRVFVVTGGLTAMMRGLWGLNRLAGGPANEKDRIDHRHHAIDALVVALSHQGHTTKFNTAAARAENQHLDRGFLDVAPPWEGFYEQTKQAVDGIVVSFRANRKLRGKLHQDSMYSPDTHGSRRIRRELHQLKASEIDQIVDARIAHAIRARLTELKQTEPAKAFADPGNLPVIKDKAGHETRIRRVRVKVNAKPTAIGSGPNRRHVKLGSNHHVVIAHDDKDKWFESTVSLIEAMRRKSQGEDIIQTPPGLTFLYSLTKNDHVVIEDEELGERIMRVDSMSPGDIELVEHDDGRPAKERGKDRVRLMSSKRWTELKPRKVQITHLGELKDAGG